MAEKTFKKVCECVNCGNEAEMVITCTLDEEKAADETLTPKVVAEGQSMTEGHAVCSHCGSEADIWLDV